MHSSRVSSSERNEVKMRECAGRHHQDSLWSWLVCFTATLSDGLHLSLAQSFAVVLPILVKEFNETRENAAWVGSIAYSMTFLASPLCSLCCKHFGYRKTAVIGSTICAVGLVISSFAPSINLLYFSYSFMLGGGGSLLHISGILLVQRCFNKKRSLATGILASGSSFGVMLGPLYQLFIEQFYWRITYRIVASWFGIPLLLALLIYSPNIEDNTTEVLCEHKKNVVQAPTKKRWANVYRPEIKCSFWNSSYVIAVITIALQSFGIYTPLIHLVKYTNEIGLPTQKASMLFIYIGITSLIGKICAGRLCDSPRVSVFCVNQIAGFICGISIILLKFPSDEKGFIMFACFYGLGLGSFITTLYLVFLNTVQPKDRPIALATGEVISAISVLVGPPFIGFIADKLDSYDAAFAVSGGIVIAASMIPFLRYRLKTQSSPEIPPEE